MLSSKLKSILTVGLLSSSLVACTLPSPQSRDGSSSSSFFADSTEIKASQERFIKGFSIPEARSFHFKVCMKDRKQSKAIINNEFTIDGAGSTSTTKSTDASGCLNWDEEISYNHFADAQYVTLERTISAHGFHQGEKKLRIAINPWENQAFDLEKSDVRQLVSAESSKEALFNTKTSTKSILASDLQVSIQEKQKTERGLRMTMEVRGQPSVELRKSSNEVSTAVFSEGVFKARIRVFHTVVENGKELHNQVAASETLKIATNKGQLYLSFPFELSELCTRGQYQLGLELEADLPAPYKLNKFEGLYFLSECDQIKGNFFARLQQNTNTTKDAALSLDTYATSIKTGSSEPAGKGYQKSNYIFQELVAVNVNSKESSGLQRKSTLRLSTCISSPLDKKPLIGYEFEITKMNGTKTSLPTSNAGCLYWDDSVEFGILAQECEKLSSISLVQKELGINEKIPVLINPWNNSVRDLSYNKELTKQPAQCAQGGTQIFTEQFSLKKTEYSYDVDAFLNLKIKMHALLSMRFQIQRPSLTEESGLTQVDAPIGDYKLQIALLKNEVAPEKAQPSDVLLYTEQAVHLEAKGVLSHPIVLSAENLKEIGSSNQIFITLTPAKPIEGFKKSIFRGSLILANASDSSPLEILSTPGAADLMTGFAQAKSAQDKLVLQSQQTVANKESLSKEFLLYPMNINKPEQTIELRKTLATPTRLIYPELNSPQRPVMEVQALSELVRTEQMSQDLAKRFCSYWFYDYWQRPWKRTGEPSVHRDANLLMAPVRRCQILVSQDPRKFFDIQGRSFVKDPQITQVRDGIFRELSISSAFSFGTSHGHSETSSFTFDRGFGLSARLFDVLGISAGLRWANTSSDQTSDQMGHQVSFSSQVNSTVETVSLRIKAAASEKCLIIKIKPEIFLDPKISGIDAQRLFNPHLNAAEKVSAARGGLLLCEGTLQQKPFEFIENYYILNQNIRGGAALNPNSSKNRPFYAAIRGDSDFVSFLSLTQKDFKLPESYAPDFRNRELLMDRSGAFFLKNLPGSPGQYVHAR